MAHPPPHLQVSGLPGASTDDANATLSPARGAAMRDYLQSRLQKKNRAPPLVHSWDFYHDRQDRAHNTTTTTTSPSSSSNNNNNNNTTTTTNNASASSPSEGASRGSGPGSGPNSDPHYAARLEHLAVINDVKQFWNVYNNFDLARLSVRDSVHLFHKGVRPVWEDGRNAHGGSWTFRVAHAHSAAFWKEVCLMAIGEQLQAAVEEEARAVFRDDICGVSLAVRFNSCLVQVWNRDGEHAQGIERLRAVVVQGLSEELRPSEGSYYYKRHCEHAGFAAPAGTSSGAARTAAVDQAQGASIDAVLADAT